MLSKLISKKSLFQTVAKSFSYYLLADLFMEFVDLFMKELVING